MPKENNNTDTSKDKSAKNGWKNSFEAVKPVIIGIWNLLVIASITYAAAVIVLGTEGLTPQILIAPMVAFALGKLIKQFIKK